MEAIFENNSLFLPPEIRKKLKIKNRQKMKINILDDKTIKLQTIDEVSDKCLLSYLEKGFHMGKASDLTREVIYEDID